jgi:tetratricopeptide (TPR) repeat protein
MPSRDRHRRPLLAAALYSATLSLLLAPAARSVAEDESRFKNLQVLPKDTSPEALMNLMRFDFVGGLGVRCSHCHVGREDQSLDDYDFASDEKAAKRIARSMLRMTRQINDELLAGLEERGDPPVRVQCVTCHRGQERPRLIQDVLHRTIGREGVAAAVAEYRRLREEHYGSHTFDFGETALTRLARTLQAEGRTADAVAILELNVEQHPEFWYSHVLLGDYLAEEDQRRAIRHLERALELAPEGSRAFLEERLTALRSPQAPEEP